MMWVCLKSSNSQSWSWGGPALHALDASLSQHIWSKWIAGYCIMRSRSFQLGLSSKDRSTWKILLRLTYYQWQRVILVFLTSFILLFLSQVKTHSPFALLHSEGCSGWCQTFDRERKRWENIPPRPHCCCMSHSLAVCHISARVNLCSMNVWVWRSKDRSDKDGKIVKERREL